MARKRATGSVQRRGGRWSIVIRNYRDPQTGEFKLQKWFSYGHRLKRDAEDKLREILEIPERFAIDSVVALGYPAEEPVMIEMTDSTKYFKDKRGRLHVPKRKLEDIMSVRE